MSFPPGAMPTDDSGGTGHTRGAPGASAGNSTTPPPTSRASITAAGRVGCSWTSQRSDAPGRTAPEIMSASPVFRSWITTRRPASSSSCPITRAATTRGRELGGMGCTSTRGRDRSWPPMSSDPDARSIRSDKFAVSARTRLVSAGRSSGLVSPVRGSMVTNPFGWRATTIMLVVPGEWSVDQLGTPFASTLTGAPTAHRRNCRRSGIHRSRNSTPREKEQLSAELGHFRPEATVSPGYTESGPCRTRSGTNLDRDVLDHEELHRSRWLSAPVRHHGGVGDVVQHLLAVDQLPKDGVVLLQLLIGQILMHDEELATLGVRSRVCHGKRALVVAQVITRELIVKRVARSTPAGAGRVATLEHETRDNAMEGRDIVVVVHRKADEVVDSLWRRIGVEIEDHLTLVGGDHGLIALVFVDHHPWRCVPPRVLHDIAGIRFWRYPFISGPATVRHKQVGLSIGRRGCLPRLQCRYRVRIVAAVALLFLGQYQCQEHSDDDRHCANSDDGDTLISCRAHHAARFLSFMDAARRHPLQSVPDLSLIHISEPTR